MSRWELLHGDCRAVMANMGDASVDSVVTDPPYHLTSIVKRFGPEGAAPAQYGTDGAYARAARGFMGQTWDGGDVAFDPALWAEVLRVLKPGGHLLAFSGSRTYHRMAVAIEDAGFEIRDQIMWLYGSGFPKSLNISKAIDKAAGAERAVIGAHPYADRASNSGQQFDGFTGDDVRRVTAPATPEAQQWEGWGTALKPAHEPIVLARKPLIGTVAQTVLAHGTGALNIDGCRIESGPDINDRVNKGSGLGYGSGSDAPRGEFSTAAGRFPANVMHDGSDEVIGSFPGAGDNSVSRFFYCAKASKADRDEGLEGFDEQRTGGMQATADGSMRTGRGNERTTSRANTHPTVKPEALMRYLCRLITPPGGLVFDPFTGSGSTGKAALLEGFRFIGAELTDDYIPIARARIASGLRA